MLQFSRKEKGEKAKGKKGRKKEKEMERKKEKQKEGNETSRGRETDCIWQCNQEKNMEERKKM